MIIIQRFRHLLLIVNFRSQSHLMVLSHWPHIAEQVPQQFAELVAELVEQHVASVKAL